VRLRARPIGAVLIALLVSACATSRPPSSVSVPAAPRFASYPTPDIPAGLAVAEDVRRRHEAAWSRLQAGDLRGASREFSAVLKQAPQLYPAEVGLGFVHLAGEDYEDAEPRFAAAVAADPQYLPAWVGRADALVGLGRDEEAIGALQRVLALDPARPGIQARLDLLRFRTTQTSLSAGQRARAAGRHDEAVLHFERALAQSPESTMILGELARAEIALARPDQAEQRVRRAMQIEPREADWQALLGEVFAARGQLREASEAYARADRLEPDESWRTRSRELRDRAESEALPEAFRNVTSAATITRADVAAFVAIQLRDLVSAAPPRVTTVATDVRTHWAAPWILSVTRTGIMTVLSAAATWPA
jgi:tetratricopeptide (TPR) repeat protein